MKTYKLDDSVLARVVEIVQEAFLTGIDCVDMMRMIELTEYPDGKLHLSDAYVQMVERHYKEMVAAKVDPSQE